MFLPHHEQVPFLNIPGFANDALNDTAEVCIPMRHAGSGTQGTMPPGPGGGFTK
jgi:hypothetical protein